MSVVHADGYGDDLFTEPDGDPETLANLGPLAPMAGVWEGVKEDPTGKQIALAEGKPLVFAGGTKGIKLGAGLMPHIVEVGEGSG